VRSRGHGSLGTGGLDCAVVPGPRWTRRATRGHQALGRGHACLFSGDRSGAAFFGTLFLGLPTAFASVVPTLEALQRASVRTPFTTVLLAMGLDRVGRPDEAQAVWDTCPAWACEVLLERTANAYALALAARLSPSSSTAHFYLGQRLRADGRLDEAAAAFARAANLDTVTGGMPPHAFAPASRYSKAEALYRLGETRLVNGQPAASRQLMEQVRALDPRHYWAPMIEAIAIQALGAGMRTLSGCSRNSSAANLLIGPRCSNWPVPTARNGVSTRRKPCCDGRSRSRR